MATQPLRSGSSASRPGQDPAHASTRLPADERRARWILGLALGVYLGHLAAMEASGGVVGELCGTWGGRMEVLLRMAFFAPFVLPAARFGGSTGSPVGALAGLLASAVVALDLWRGRAGELILVLAGVVATTWLVHRALPRRWRVLPLLGPPSEAGARVAMSAWPRRAGFVGLYWALWGSNPEWKLGVHLERLALPVAAGYLLAAFVVWVDARERLSPGLRAAHAGRPRGARR